MPFIFEPFASSSKGCCYRIDDGSTRLLIEAGVSMKALHHIAGPRPLDGVEACLISHSHGDHAKFARQLLNRGVAVYASSETLEALGIEGHHLGFALGEEPVQIGTWTVAAFDAVHDCPGALGFVLASGRVRVLYLTDTAYSRCRFGSLTHILVECNWSSEILRQNVESGRVDLDRGKRVVSNHMSLERLVAMLADMDLSQLQATWLLHLSDDNSDEEAFVEAVRRVTGKPVYVAPRRAWL